MSRNRRTRGRRARPAVSGGPLTWVRSLPARLHLRWLVIVVVTAVVMGAYGRLLLTAPPMPPSKAPSTGGEHRSASATPHRGQPSHFR